MKELDSRVSKDEGLGTGVDDQNFISAFPRLVQSPFMLVFQTLLRDILVHSLPKGNLIRLEKGLNVRATVGLREANLDGIEAARHPVISNVFVHSRKRMS